MIEHRIVYSNNYKTLILIGNRERKIILKGKKREKGKKGKKGRKGKIGKK